jgi:hypothetical protein
MHLHQLTTPQIFHLLALRSYLLCDHGDCEILDAILSSFSSLHFEILFKVSIPDGEKDTLINVEPLMKMVECSLISLYIANESAGSTSAQKGNA